MDEKVASSHVHARERSNTMGISFFVDLKGSGYFYDDRRVNIGHGLFAGKK